MLLRLICAASLLAAPAWASCGALSFADHYTDMLAKPGIDGHPAKRVLLLGALTEQPVDVLKDAAVPGFVAQDLNREPPQDAPGRRRYMLRSTFDGVEVTGARDVDVRDFAPRRIWLYWDWHEALGDTPRFWTPPPGAIFMALAEQHGGESVLVLTGCGAAVELAPSKGQIEVMAACVDAGGCSDQMRRRFLQ